MDENEEMLDEELDAEDAGEDLDDADADEEYDEDDTGIDDSVDSESDIDDDDDFEYDEEGNIIIPDASENDAEGEDDGEVEEQPSGENVQAEEPTKAEGGKSADDDKDARIRELEAKLGEFEAQSKATLSKLGIEGDSPMEGLIKLAAEADGVTPEQYKKQLADAAAKKSAADARQAQIEIDDLIALKAVYPELKDTQSIRDIPNFLNFGKFRDMGLNPKEAYSAANPDGIREGVAASVKAQSLAGTKDHIKSNVPKASKDNSMRMPKATLEEWRGIFPKKSDKELVALWKQSMKN